MASFEDMAVLEHYMTAQEKDPPSYQVGLGGRRIYESQADFGPLRGAPKFTQITDLGSAVVGDETHSHAIQPQQFRAPEIIMRSEWSYSADIWNFGMVVCDMIPHPRLLSPASLSLFSSTCEP